MVLQWNSVPTPIVMSNLILMGITFLALSSFPPFCQSCHSLGQRREGEGESMLCQLSRVTSAFTPFFCTNGNKLWQSSKCHDSHKGTCKEKKNKTCISVSALSHTQSSPHENLHAHTYPSTHSLQPFLWEDGVCSCVHVCVLADTRVKVMSHLISVSTHCLFTWLYYHMLTQSHDLRAGGAEPRAPRGARSGCDERHGSVTLRAHTHTTKHSHKDLHNMISSFRFQIPIFPPTLTLYRALIEIL